jgi:predicted RNA-binding protein with PIN domain
LRFARLPTPALEVARRVLDADSAFRQRVTEATSEAEVGRAAWLWLSRPEGWEQELDALRREVQEREVEAREARAEHDARRRLARAEDAARRADATIAERDRELAELKADLAAARRAREIAEAELERLRASVDVLRDDRNQAMRIRKNAESELANRTADLRHARHQLRMTEQELEQALVAGARGVAEAAPEAVVAPTTAAPTPALAAQALDRAALGAAVAAASDAAAALALALETSSALLAGSERELGPTTTSASPAPPVTGFGLAASQAVLARTPPPLPPGVLDDSVEACEYLVRRPGAVLLVDGYNVSQTAWPAAPAAEQRARLVGALTGLQARSGAVIEVVFDGSTEQWPVAPATRTPVRVRFSPPDVEADDVILALVDEQPADRPVVVASSDRRIQDGARDRGARAVSSRQLLGTLRR